MEDAQLLAVPADEPVQVHQAGDIAAGDHLGSGALVIGDAVASHRAGNRLLGHGERPAESAALVGAGQLGEPQALDSLEQRDGLGERRNEALAAAAQTQLAQTMAALVQPHLVWEAAAWLDLENVVEELAQLARLRAQPGDAGISGQQRFEVVPHHAGAASGWAHHVLVRGEHVQHLPGERARVVEEPGIRHRLAAARLPLGEPHRDAIPLEQLRRGKANARVELVDVARDEEGDLHRASL